MGATIPRLRDLKKDSTQRKTERQRMYADTQYRQTRDWLMRTHPICQDCEADGLVTASAHCHHVMSPFDIGISRQEAYRRLRDPYNLRCLCVYHHELAHGLASKEMQEEYNTRLNRLTDDIQKLQNSDP